MSETASTCGIRAATTRRDSRSDKFYDPLK
jgi:hypothetical protein